MARLLALGRRWQWTDDVHGDGPLSRPQAGAVLRHISNRRRQLSLLCRHRVVAPSVVQSRCRPTGLHGGLSGDNKRHRRCIRQGWLSKAAGRLRITTLHQPSIHRTQYTTPRTSHRHMYSPLRSLLAQTSKLKRVCNYTVHSAHPRALRTVCALRCALRAPTPCARSEEVRVGPAVRQLKHAHCDTSAELTGDGGRAVSLWSGWCADAEGCRSSVSAAEHRHRTWSSRAGRGAVRISLALSAEG